MMIFMPKKQLLLIAALLSVIACTTTTIPPGQDPDKILDGLYMEGSRDAVALLREGLRSRKEYGVSDPYIPLRTPDEVIPIWVPAHLDKYGRRVDEHWEHSVVREGSWYTD